MTILEAIANARRPLSVSEIAERSGLDKPEVRNACETCITEGVLICAKGGKYALPYMLGLKKCTVKAKGGAPAFARASDGGSDIYLDMPYEQAFDGDIEEPSDLIQEETDLAKHFDPEVAFELADLLGNTFSVG